MRQLCLEMIDGGWVLAKMSFSNRKEFDRFLADMKHALDVFVYDKSIKKYVTSVYELNRLNDLCDSKNVEMFATEKVMRNHRRLIYKAKKTKELLKEEDSTLELKLWTDDKDRQIRHYQAKAVKLMAFRKRFLLGDDMGLGKTIQAIAVMLLAWEKFEYTDGLFVVTNRIMNQWKNEIHSFSKLRPNQVEVLGDRVCRTREQKYFLKVRKDCKSCKFYDACLYDSEVAKKSAAAFRTLQIKRARVLIASYTSMRLHTKDFIDRKFEVTIFDEATRLKNRTSGVSKGAKKIISSLPLSNVVIPMSGTFIENRLEELYTVMDLVDPRVLGGFFNFKNRHMTTDHFGNVIGYRNEDKLKFKLDNMLIRRTIDEVWHDRPEMVESIIECPMDKQQAKFYAEARDGVLKQIADMKVAQQINTSSVGALLTYLLMISSTVKSVDPETDIKEHSSKCAMLKEILDGGFSSKSKMVIFSRFTNRVTPFLLEEMKSMGLGKIATVKNKKSQEAVLADFRDNPDTRFLVCSDAMAYGSNLQCANYLVNFDLPWNPAILDQRIRRIYRGGQKRNVNIYNFIVPNTAEEHLYQVLQRKRALFAKYFKESVTGSKGASKIEKGLTINEMIKMI